MSNLESLSGMLGIVEAMLPIVDKIKVTYMYGKQKLKDGTYEGMLITPDDNATEKRLIINTYIKDGKKCLGILFKTE